MKIYRNGELIEPKTIVKEDEETDIFCMSNLRGCKVAVPHKLPFSFYFSTRESSHAIRVKPVFNANRISKSELGTLELHGDWKYTPGSDDRNVSGKQIKEMKEFFRTYKVLFAAVWEEELPEDEVAAFFRGDLSFSDLLSEFYCYEEYKEDLDNIKDVSELEKFVRENSLFNMSD